MTTPLERIMYATHRLIRAERLAKFSPAMKRLESVAKRKSELVKVAKCEYHQSTMRDWDLFK